MDIFYNEEKGAWDVLEPPYCTVYLQTKEDYDHFREILDYWKAHHKTCPRCGATLDEEDQL